MSDYLDDAPRDRATGRFRKGVTGNPRGRPRKSITVDSAILGALGEKVAINRNGRSRRVTLAQATALQMANRGAAGDARVGKIAFDLAQKAEDRLAAATPATADFAASDAEIIERIAARIVRARLGGEE